MSHLPKGATYFGHSVVISVIVVVNLVVVVV